MLTLLALKGVAQSNIFFTDNAFKQAVINDGHDLNEDGEISYDEANSIFHLNISNSNIGNLDDLPNFPNVSYLDVSYNYYLFDAFGIEFLPSLNHLIISHCNLTELNAAEMTNLEVLDCSFNNLEVLILPQGNNLVELQCAGNELISLNIKYSTGISYLDISNMPSLEKLCVWEIPFPVNLSAINSPNVTYTTNCCSASYTLNTIPAKCPGDSNGSVYVFIQGGVSPYQCALNDGAFQNSTSFSNLPAGTFTMKVKDGNTCVVEKEFEIGTQETKILDLPTDTFFCESSSVQLAANLNTFSSYSWSTGSDQQSIEVSSAGTYKLTTTTKLGCELSDSTVVAARDCINFQEDFTCTAFNWANVFGGDGMDVVTSIAVSEGGNIFVAAETRSTSISYPGETAPAVGGSGDIALAKFNAAGTLEWVKIFGASSTDQHAEITAAKNGGVFLAFNGGMNTNINGTEYNNNSNGLFLVKLTENGDTEWAKYTSNGSSGFDFLDLETDADGNVYGIGNYSYTSFTFDTVQVYSSGNGGVFIMKFTPEGSALWAVSLEDKDNTWHQECDLDVDENNNVYFTFISGNEVKLDGQTIFTSNKEEPGQFIGKLDFEGNYLWGNYISGGVETDSDVNLAVSSDRLYIAGDYRGYQIQIGDTILNSYNEESSSGYLYYNTYFAALDTEDGSYLWAKNHGGSGSDIHPGSMKTKGDTLYFSGSTYGSTIYFGNEKHLPYTNHFLGKFNKDGLPYWMDSQFGGPLFDIRSNGLFSAGTFNYNLTFNSSSFTSNGAADIYINKIEESPAATGSFHSQTTICPGDTAYLETSHGYYNYLWSGESGKHLMGFTGPDTISVQVVDRKLCRSLPDTVIIATYDDPILDLGPDTLNVLSFPVNLDAGPAFTSYNWSTGHQSQEIQVYFISGSEELYFVMAEDINGCLKSDSVLLIEEIITALPDTDARNDISFYPNPASDQITLKIPDDVNEIHLRTLDGKLMLRKRLSGISDKHIYTGGLPEGVYIVSFYGKDGMIKSMVLNKF